MRDGQDDWQPTNHTALLHFPPLLRPLARSHFARCAGRLLREPLLAAAQCGWRVPALTSCAACFGARIAQQLHVSGIAMVPRARRSMACAAGALLSLTLLWTTAHQARALRASRSRAPPPADAPPQRAQVPPVASPQPWPPARIPLSLEAASQPFRYDVVVLASPRAGGADPPCATLRGVRRAASPRALALAFGRAVSGTPSGDNATVAAAYLHALLTTCGDALDAVFVPPPGAAPGPLEGYLAALLAGGELARAAPDAPPAPLLVLEDDVALAAAFEPALRAAVHALRAAGVRHFVLNLYNGHLPPLARGSAAALAARASRRNAAMPRCAHLQRLLRRCGNLPVAEPLDARLGAGLLRGGWGWGTQALLFSHAGDAASHFADRAVRFPALGGSPAYVGLQDLLLYEFLFHPQAAAALACGWQPASSTGACGDGAPAMQPPPAVYGLDVSLVQHTGAASTLFGATSAANSRFHAAADFLDDIEADIRADENGAATSRTVSEAESPGIANSTRASPAVQTLRWPAAVTGPADCAAAALIVPCCVGTSGFAPPGAPLSAAALPSAVAAAPRPSLFDASSTDALITFRLSGVPCPRFGCSTAPLALRAGARAGEDAAALARLLGGDAPVLPALLRRLQPPPATALLAQARSGVAVALLAHAWPGVRLVAVEPEAHAFAALQRNAYGIANITTLRAQTRRLLRRSQDSAAERDGPTLGELVATQLGAGARGFDFVWLDGVDDAALRDALVAGWLAAARAIAVELRSDDAAALLRGALPRRDWARARLGTPPRQLHVFTRRVAHAVAEARQL